ncbi:hypothetical protein D3C75_981740 [compost metagenome]
MGKHRFIESVAGLLVGLLGAGLGVEQLLRLLEHCQLLLVGGDLDTGFDAGSGHLLLVVHGIDQSALFPALLLDKALQCLACLIQRGLQGIELFLLIGKKAGHQQGGWDQLRLVLGLANHQIRALFDLFALVGNQLAQYPTCRPAIL